ncbi:MAG: hypothetical protein GX256_01995 [Fretibacterium sp.]|nr:hypothetical protein [Fretibacterium sp.]
MHDETFDRYAEVITRDCLDYLASAGFQPLSARATAMMKHESFPIHAPIHHYLVPALLLSEVRKRQGRDEETLRADLEEATERGRSVPGGSCGFLGACGAAVGVGIFWSLITDTSPLSTKSWAYGNEETGKALLALAAMGGPRCCKRAVYGALHSAIPRIRELLELNLPDEPVVCEFHDNNKECIRVRCPYHPDYRKAS